LVPVYEPLDTDNALSSCPKLAELVTTLERIRKKGEKGLIFTRSIDMQQLLSSVLQDKFGVAGDIVNGATSRQGGSRGAQQTRQSILRRFRESPGFDAVILSPDVAGLGLTLVFGTTSAGTGSLPQLGEDDVRRLSWDRFEALVAALWAKERSDVVLTPKTGDEGVDVIAFRYPTVELVQCKHTVWDSSVDADAIADLIQAFDGCRARRFRQLSKSVLFRMTLVTNGKLTSAARKAARERDIHILAGADLMRKLEAQPCTAMDVQTANDRRLASMRDVQARISAFCG
jgi:hypothetical protein